MFVDRHSAFYRLKCVNTRAQNEIVFGQWFEEVDGGRVYVREVQGRHGWIARYLKKVDKHEKLLRFSQEILDPRGKRVEIHDNPIGENA